MSSGFQAAIAGGGVVGLACALLLNRRCGWNIALAERSPPLKSNGSGPQRALTLSPGAVDVLFRCGLPGSEDIPPASKAGAPSLPGHAFSRMVVWRGEEGPAPGNSITFDAAELGAQALGFVIHEAPLRRALWERSQSCSGIQLYSGAALKSVRTGPENGCLELEDGNGIDAELLVGADGAQSGLRLALGIDFQSSSYGQTGLVFEADCSEPGGDTAWQRFSGGGALALLPMGESRFSIVWSLPDEQAERLRRLKPKGLKAALNDASASVAGELTPATPIASFPLRRGQAARVCGERYALVGEAARTVHPLAGQGLNLGLGDAAALAGVCRRQGDALIGDARVLSRFARERSRYGQEMSFGVHAINAAFEGAFAPLASLALGAVNRAPPLKRLLAARAMR